jgi:hypothetical protein
MPDDDQKYLRQSKAPYATIAILGPLTTFLQTGQRLTCNAHGTVRRLAWVCVHVAVDGEDIATVERPRERDGFNPQLRIGIITCARARHSEHEFVVIREKCIRDKILGQPDWK